jgi:hypothetical protein
MIDAAGENPAAFFYFQLIGELYTRKGDGLSPSRSNWKKTALCPNWRLA